MRYFAKLHTDHWQPKNNLENAWQNYCRNHDRVILEDEAARDAYVDVLRNKLEMLCNQYGRCKPLAWSDWDASPNVQFIGVSGLATIGIWNERQPITEPAATTPAPLTKC